MRLLSKALLDFNGEIFLFCIRIPNKKLKKMILLKTYLFLRLVLGLTCSDQEHQTIVAIRQALDTKQAPLLLIMIKGPTM